MAILIKLYIETMYHLTLIQCCDNFHSGFLSNLCIILCSLTSSTMKGDKNRKKNKSSDGHFKKGHNKSGPGRPLNESDKSVYDRPNAEEATLLDSDPVMHNALKFEGPELYTMLLRPRNRWSRSETCENSRPFKDTAWKAGFPS